MCTRDLLKIREVGLQGIGCGKVDMTTIITLGPIQHHPIDSIGPFMEVIKRSFILNDVIEGNATADGQSQPCNVDQRG